MTRNSNDLALFFSFPLTPSRGGNISISGSYNSSGSILYGDILARGGALVHVTNGLVVGSGWMGGRFFYSGFCAGRDWVCRWRVALIGAPPTPSQLPVLPVVKPQVLTPTLASKAPETFPYGSCFKDFNSSCIGFDGPNITK